MFASCANLGSPGFVFVAGVVAEQIVVVGGCLILARGGKATSSGTDMQFYHGDGAEWIYVSGVSR